MDTKACHTAIWIQLQNGHQHALLELYNQHYTGLMNYGIKLTGQRELTTECITQILLRLWDNRDKLPLVENVRSYLLTCLRRELMAELKMETNRAYRDKLFQHSKSEEDFSYEEYLVQLQHNNEMKKLIGKALSTLTQREKELLQLKFFEDLDYDEIAGRCNITKRTAYNIIHHALKTLKTAFIQLQEPDKIIYNPAILAPLCCILLFDPFLSACF